MPDQEYKSFPYALSSKGLAAKISRDMTPEQMYWNLDNLEVRQEGAISSRLGRSAITTDGTDNTPIGQTASGPRSPASGTNETSEGTVAWSNPGNILASDDVWATVSLDQGTLEESQRLLAQQFGDTIPGGATILGIVIEVEGNQTAGGNAPTEAVRLWKAGTGAVGNTKSQTRSLSGGDFVLTYGAPNDLWGTTWTPAEINDIGSGAFVRELTNPGPTATVTVRIDRIRRTVYYTTTPSIHTLSRLKSIGQTYRYAGAGTSIYRRAGDTNGAYTNVANGLVSGSRFSVASYRPDFSGKPYAFFADASAMLKDSGAMNPLQQWGIFPPNAPPTVAVQQFSRTVINEFGAAGMTFSNYTGTSNPNRVNTTLGTGVTGGQISTVTPAAMTNIIPGVILRIDSGGGSQEDVAVLEVTSTTFKAYFANNHTNTHTVIGTNLQGSVAANTTATITQSGALNLDSIGGAQADDEDVINLYLKVSDPTSIEEIRVKFDVGAGTFTDDYYEKAINPTTFQDAVDGLTPALQAALNRLYNRASGQLDNRYLPIDSGGNDNFPGFLPEDDPALLGLRPIEFLSGDNVWSRIQIKRNEFLKVGLAGIPGKTWANVNAWRILIKTNQNGSVTASFDDFYLFGGSGPDVFGGVPFEYRMTYYNENTGEESSPSVPMVSENFVSPKRQPVKITWSVPSDAQITHVRIYRKGGVLPDAFRHIRRDSGVAVGAGTYTDNFSDSNIASNKVLEFDNDPPVSVTLPSPVSTTLGTSVTAGSSQTVTPGSMTNIYLNQILTIDEGSNEETVVVTATTGSQFTAYFQRAHTSSARVYGVDRRGQAMNLAAAAFERMWLAGDPNNPNRLYYSKRQRASSFGPQNYIEIGNPEDPIMAVIAPHRGQLFVATLSRWWRVLDGTIPRPVPTSSRIGLKASFAWCLAEGMILYLSHDGIYAFTGEQSSIVSDTIGWLLEDKDPNLGPVKEIDPAQASDSIMAFHRNEMFFGYTDKNAVRRRLTLERSSTDGSVRWRNDSVPVTAMFLEEDTHTLVIARANGMIYKDRTGNVDGEGFSGGVAQTSSIPINIETRDEDNGLPKNDKVYNELTLDVDTNGQNLTAELLFDNGTSAVTISSAVNATGRTKLQFNIGSGSGRTSKTVSLRLIGSVTNIIHLYGWHIKAVVEAEKRRSMDFYKMDFGFVGFKIAKEVWVQYQAPDAGGVVVNVYLEDSSTPEFSFTLPQATVKTARRVRWPANKAKLWRITGTSSGDFQFYPGSFVSVKPISGKGFAPVPLPEEAP